MMREMSCHYTNKEILMRKSNYYTTQILGILVIVTQQNTVMYQNSEFLS